MQTPTSTHASAEKYGTILNIMLLALDREHVSTYDLVAFSQGRTYNDGGTTYSGVFKTYVGSARWYRATIPSDYQMNTVKVSRVVPVNHNHTEYRS